jgi:hypothetical protein
MMRITFFFAILLLFAGPIFGGELVKYVDPDATGAGNGNSWTDAYTSLATCISTEAQDLTDNGGDTLLIWCRSSGGTDDTSAVVIAGGAWTTSATCTVTIQGYDFPSDGVLDTSKYN